MSAIEKLNQRVNEEGEMNSFGLKYEITDIENPEVPGLFRVRALRNIYRGDYLDNQGLRAKKGDLGGWVENSENLAQEGECWISDNAVACNNSRVRDDAWVRGTARLSGDSSANDNAIIQGYADLFDNASALGRSIVAGGARLCDNATICDSARAIDSATISGIGSLTGNSILCDRAVLSFPLGNMGNDLAIGGNAEIRTRMHVLKAYVADFIYPAILWRERGGGHRIFINQWVGTLASLRSMIESENYDSWYPDLGGSPEIYRDEIIAFANMCEARVARWTKNLDKKETQCQ